MDGELAIAVRRERGVVIVAVTGDIDISTVPPLRERLSELADRVATGCLIAPTLQGADSTGAHLGALRQFLLSQARGHPVALEERCKSRQLTRDHGSCPRARCPSNGHCFPAPDRT